MVRPPAGGVDGRAGRDANGRGQHARASFSIPSTKEAKYSGPTRSGHALRDALRARAVYPRRGLWHTRSMPSTPPTIRLATEADLPAINAIYNREILEGVATWDTEPWSPEQRLEWFREHTRPGAVALVADLPDDPLAGFGYLSFYKARLGYRFTREDTLYVRPELHRRGIGRALLAALLDDARGLGVHAVLARIEATNEASIALHRALGFEVVGHERESGHKFGEWRSLVQMQIVLPGAPPPSR